MTTDERIEAMVKSYKFTVLALCSVILASFVALMVILLWAVPAIVEERFISVLETYEAEIWPSE